MPNEVDFRKIPGMFLLAVVSGLFLFEIPPVSAQHRQPPETVEPETSCLAEQCHANLRSGAVIHGPLAEGDDACQLCHKAEGKSHAFSYPATGAELCYNCHESVTEKKLVHAPLTNKEASCTICHNPHSSANKKLLKFEKTAPDLCLDCHEDFKPTAAEMSDRHHLLLEGENCARCHDPHSSEMEHLLLDDSQSLCLTCHAEGVKSSEGRAIAGLKQVLDKNVHLHSPGKSLDCTLCHQPHANKEYRFLRGEYPRTFYSPYSSQAYGLCFTCHDESLVAAAETDAATEFRNGSTNLHYLHVNKEKKGRTCRACHAWHVSKSPHLLSESVPFGQWQIPINFTATENGGSCSPGCHRGKTYDRLKAILDKPASGTQTGEVQETAGKTGG